MWVLTLNRECNPLGHLPNKLPWNYVSLTQAHCWREPVWLYRSTNVRVQECSIYDAASIKTQVEVRSRTTCLHGLPWVKKSIRVVGACRLINSRWASSRFDFPGTFAKKRHLTLKCLIGLWKDPQVRNRIWYKLFNFNESTCTPSWLINVPVSTDWLF